MTLCNQECPEHPAGTTKLHAQAFVNQVAICAGSLLRIWQIICCVILRSAGGAYAERCDLQLYLSLQAGVHMPSNLPCLFQGDKEAMQTLLNKSAKLLATTVDENRRRYGHHTCSLLKSTMHHVSCTHDAEVLTCKPCTHVYHQAAVTYVAHLHVCLCSHSAVMTAVDCTSQQP